MNLQRLSFNDGHNLNMHINQMSDSNSPLIVRLDKKVKNR